MRLKPDCIWCVFILGWPLAIARDWTKYVDTNVCAVDWSVLSRQPLLIASQLYTRVVGQYIAEFITQLIRHGVESDNVSVAGHSLGGQVVGYVGQNLINQNVTIGRIYGLCATFFSLISCVNSVPSNIFLTCPMHSISIYSYRPGWHWIYVPTSATVRPHSECQRCEICSSYNNV